MLSSLRFTAAACAGHFPSLLSLARLRLVAGLCLLVPGLAAAAGDAEKGRAEWEYTCQHCHGTPQPNKEAAFSDYGPTANRLSVYANDPAAITKAATLGYTIPPGNTNDKEAPGGSTNSPMGTWAGMAPNRLGLGTTPTQFASNFSAYFASLFAAPGQPAGVTVTAGDGQATVSFTAPQSELAITGYTVTAYPGGLSASGAASPITVSGLANGTEYTFTVTAVSQAGSGKPSAPSAKVAMAAAGQGTAVPSVPAVKVPAAPVPVTVKAAPASVQPTAAQAPAANAPYIKYVKAGNASARIFFDVPADAANITGYTVTALANGASTGITAVGGKSPITITGLANGTDYTFTLTANSSKKGQSQTSAPSSTATPLRLLGD